MRELNVWTAQLGQWRKVTALGLTVFDTTVRSGDKRVAPLWSMVLDHKAGTITDQEYTEKYLALMDKSIREHNDFWIDLIHRKNLVLCCYCKSRRFCHRHLLKDILKQQCELRDIRFIDRGEIE